MRGTNVAIYGRRNLPTVVLVIYVNIRFPVTSLSHYTLEREGTVIVVYKCLPPSEYCSYTKGG